MCDLLDKGDPCTTNFLQRYLVLFAKSLTLTKLDNSVKHRIVTSIKCFAQTKQQVFTATLQCVLPEFQAIITEALNTNTIMKH